MDVSLWGLVSCEEKEKFNVDLLMRRLSILQSKVIRKFVRVFKHLPRNDKMSNQSKPKEPISSHH
jgi:hypothetical protein